MALLADATMQIGHSKSCISTTIRAIKLRLNEDFLGSVSKDLGKDLDTSALPQCCMHDLVFLPLLHVMAALDCGCQMKLHM